MKNIPGIIGTKSGNIRSAMCTHTHRWWGPSQTQVLMHSAQLKAEKHPQCSPSNISILAWLCAPIPSDLAKLYKLKHNLPPVSN